MSWQSYIDSLLLPDDEGRKFVEEAAICGHISHGLWASTPGLQNISLDEIKRLSGNRSDFGQSGPYVGGLKCRLLTDLTDDEKVRCLNLKSAADADGNTYNVCVGKSHQALVIVKGTKDSNGGQLSKRVYKIVQHLRDGNM